MLARLFSFPNPVNEVSARLVAGGVVLLCLATIALDLPWMTAVIAYGFLARVLTGPTLSPLGQLVTRVVTPRLGVPERLVAGPPKRFAQGIGATLSVTAAVLALGAGEVGAAYVRARADRGRRDARVGLRVLPGLHDLRGADARRRDSRRGLRALRRHLGPRRRTGVSDARRR